MPFIPDLQSAMSTGYVLAQIFSCSAEPPPQVEVAFNASPYTINNQVTLYDLQNMPSGRHMDETLTTVGTTASNTTSSLDVGFQMLKNPVTGSACLSVSHVRVTVSYVPEILIVRDYQPQSCRYRTTFDHELKHVTTDLLVINDFLPVMKSGMQAVVDRMPTQGPLDPSEVAAQQVRIQDVLQQSLSQIAERMSTEKRRQQGMVDTPEEYNRLSQACPQEPMAEMR